MERTRARVHRNRFAAPTVRCELALERCDFVAKHELPAVEDASNRRFDLRPDRLELLAQIDEGNHSTTPA
jgi:hypothetical protein